MVQLELRILLSTGLDRPAALGASDGVLQVKGKQGSVDEGAEAGLDEELGCVEQEDGGGGYLAAVGVLVVVDGEFKIGQRIVENEGFHLLVGEMWKPAR